jgi:hypothetical protein
MELLTRKVTTKGSPGKWESALDKLEKREL